MKQVLLLFLIIIPMTLGALTLEQGNLKVVVDEKTGGFLLYGRIAQDSRWVPLLVESYTSSYLELSLNGNRSVLNGNRNYAIRLEQEEKEIIIIFDGPLVKVEDHIVFVEPSGGIPYLRLSVQIINTSDDAVEIGLKRVLDTVFLRENTHFFISEVSIERETLFTQGNIPSLILSSGKELAEKLYIAPQFQGKNNPQRLLAANWNRIDFKDWDYVPSGNTNFNSLPFSINDSALALYWDLGALGTGKMVTTSLALGNLDFTKQTTSVTGRLGNSESEVTLEYEGEGRVSSSSILGKKELPLLHVEEQLEYLDILLNDIDRLLKKGQDVSNDEVLTMDSRLEILTQKKRDYEELQ